MVGNGYRRRRGERNGGKMCGDKAPTPDGFALAFFPTMLEYSQW